MKSIKINVTDRQLIRIDQLANDIGLSRSEYCRRVFDDYLKNESPDATNVRADDKNR